MNREDKTGSASKQIRRVIFAALCLARWRRFCLSDAMKWTPGLIILAYALMLAACGENSSGQAAKPDKHTPPPRPIALDTAPKTGKELYQIHCMSCHGEQGGGVAEIFPPILSSPRLASPRHFVHGLIHGFPPPSDPDGSPWMGEMPKFQQLSDADLAKLATYVRQQWGGAKDEVTVEMVAEERSH